MEGQEGEGHGTREARRGAVPAVAHLDLSVVRPGLDVPRVRLIAEPAEERREMKRERGKGRVVRVRVRHQGEREEDEVWRRNRAEYQRAQSRTQRDSVQSEKELGRGERSKGRRGT